MHPTFRSVRLGHTECLARHAGHHGWLKRRRFSQAAKRQALFGVLGAAWMETRSGEDEERSSPSRQSVRRWNAPRPPCERIALRGAVRDRRPQRWLGVRSRAPNRPVRARDARGGSASSTQVRARQRGVRPGSRRDLARRKAARTFARVGPVRARRASPEARRLRGSSARARPRKGATRANACGRRVTSPAVRGAACSRLVPVRRRVAETSRTPSGPEKRAIGIERVESPRDIRSA